MPFTVSRKADQLEVAVGQVTHTRPQPTAPSFSPPSPPGARRGPSARHGRAVESSTEPPSSSRQPSPPSARCLLRRDPAGGAPGPEPPRAAPGRRGVSLPRNNDSRNYWWSYTAPLRIRIRTGRPVPFAKALTLTMITVLLGACGGSTTSSSQTPSTSSNSSAPAASVSPTPTPTPAPTASPLTAWCSLTIGEGQASVTAAMGPPHGNKAAAYSAPGITSVEWDIGNDILLASFANGVATNLQAYAGSVGPQGATDISCAAFRH